jgi:membrane protease subunit (stomatin/prohibitin family)
MGLLRTAARTAVISGTATAVSGRVARRQMSQAQAAAPAPAPAPAAAAPAAPAAPAVDDSTAKLQELANLHAQGVLTAEEFAAAKAKILGI